MLPRITASCMGNMHSCLRVSIPLVYTSPQARLSPTAMEKWFLELKTSIAPPDRKPGSPSLEPIRSAADDRGTLTLNSSAGAHSYTFALNGTAKIGSLMESDNSGIVGSGVMKLQDSSAFDPSVFSGGYAIDLTGMDAAGARIAAVGSIFPSGFGTISGSSLDVNDGGNMLPTFATFSGIYTVGGTGHGTATFAIPGLDAGTLHFVLYAITANEYFMLSIDPVSGGNPIFAGMVEAQTGSPFLTSSFTGASVFGSTGSNWGSSQVTAGRMEFDGVENIRVQYDQNSGGNITVGEVLTGAYSIQLNGRGVLTLDDAQTGAQSVWILYAIAPESGIPAKFRRFSGEWRCESARSCGAVRNRRPGGEFRVWRGRTSFTVGDIAVGHSLLRRRQHCLRNRGPKASWQLHWKRAAGGELFNIDCVQQRSGGRPADFPCYFNQSFMGRKRIGSIGVGP